MKKQRWMLTLALAAGLAAILTGLTLAKSPAPPPPPPPPVKYEVTWFEPIGQNLNDGVGPGTVYRVNDWGEAVGYLRFSDGVASAFRWSQATGLEELDDLIHPQDMPDPNSDWLHLASAWDTNNCGQIVGHGIHATAGVGQGFRLTPRPDGPPAMDLAIPKGESRTSGINDDGDVVGYCRYVNPPQPDVPCLWLQKTDGSMAMINIQPSASYWAAHFEPIIPWVANRYTLDGRTYIQMTGNWLCHTSHILRLPLYGPSLIPRRNVRGHAVRDPGGTRLNSLRNSRRNKQPRRRRGLCQSTVEEEATAPMPSCFPPGRSHGPGKLGTDSFAWGLNDARQIVGYSVTSSSTTRAFLYVSGKMYNLEQLIDGDLTLWKSASSVMARSINNPLTANGFGQIAGTLQTPDGKNYGFLLTPK